MQGKEIIEKLSKYFDDGVVIVGPDGRNKSFLRVYWYGGDLGKIDLKKTWHKIHSKTDYAENHLDRGEKSKRLRELIGQVKGKKVDAGEMLCSEEYLSLMREATKDYGLKPNSYNGEPIKKERMIETALIANQFKKMGKNKSIPLLIYDMEYHIALPTRKTKENKVKKSKPDFMVLDDNGIGIVELKYDADNMTKENSLENHYRDFMDFIWNETDAKRWDLVDETIHRMEMMVKAGLIPKKWEKRVEELREWYKDHCKESFDTSKFWIGFLFVEGPHKVKTNRRICAKKYVEDEIKKQLGGVLIEYKDKHIPIRYGYCENDEKPSMVLDKKIELNENDELVII